MSPKRKLGSMIKIEDQRSLMILIVRQASFPREQTRHKMAWAKGCSRQQSKQVGRSVNPMKEVISDRDPRSTRWYYPSHWAPGPVLAPRALEHVYF